ncbi:3-mercaptopyruvate sulfurtransferase [Pseudaquidulcibacter saccharophilus]|uniref:3-mercaptopyruvate sulfurtransferase n=1 Tax=Pseudaquidulcibacter saccharophilus TaxID=2831900 RepID=UPI001EFF5596|nr:3-mercaptopyruvate sulfurtransferase [Pseudaquidulcibacter saccharophilus]
MVAVSDGNCPLVSTEWLAEHIDSPDIHVIDASWFMPNSGRNAKQEYEFCHIKGAVFFDIDEIADLTSPYPHMVPSPEKFASRVRKLGLGDGVKIIIYDSHGIFSAPRVWWMFRLMGHDDVAVLDGGLKKWLAEGRPTDDAIVSHWERHFTIRIRNDLIRDFSQVLAICEDQGTQVVDARSPARFSGTEPEPRPNLNSGHIPNSINWHYAQLINSDGTMVSNDEIKAQIAALGIDLNKPIIASCGTGVTACILALALDKIGKDKVAVYDGSWAEWGARDDAPIVCADMV